MEGDVSGLDQSEEPERYTWPRVVKSVREMYVRFAGPKDNR
jgi:hypothetical protein